MNVIVHLPTSNNDMNELKNRIAFIHAQSVIFHIKNSSCSKEYQLKLINTIQNAKE